MSSKVYKKMQSAFAYPSAIFYRLALSFFVFGALLFSSTLLAAPRAKLLRVDSKAALSEGDPILTTLIDVYSHRSKSEVGIACAPLKSQERWDCLSEAFEKKGALGEPSAFPAERVALTVEINQKEEKAQYVDHQLFSAAHERPGTGTNWLVVLDADARTGKSFGKVVELASTIQESLGRHDLIKFMTLGERDLMSESDWLTSAETKSAKKYLEILKVNRRANARNRPLFTLIEAAARSGFSSLANIGSDLEAPLHHALVVISNGFGGGDPLTTGSGAMQLERTLTIGRFDNENTQVPRTPIPVISIFVPPSLRRDSALLISQKMALDETALAQEFMFGLSNPEIGGFFSILRPKEPTQSRRIVDIVRERFSHMVVARFLAPCLAPSPTQSFSLLFPGIGEAILGDQSFRDIPIGFDPRQWPLTIDAQLTRMTVNREKGIEPGGTLKVFGQFCWGSDIQRPSAYFLPAGEALPSTPLSEQGAIDLQKKLVSLDLRGAATKSGRSFVEFSVPDNDQILIGEGKRMTVRVVVVDAASRRMSGIAEDSILQLPGREKKIPRLYYVAGGLAVFLTILLLILIFKAARSFPKRGSPDSSSKAQSPYAEAAPTQVTSRQEPQREGKKVRVELHSSEGKFILLEGKSLKMGRDGSRCAALFSNPQVSGLHATMRLKEGKLYLRDEGSSSGTRKDGIRIESGQWVPLDDNHEFQLGPESIIVKFVSSLQK